MGTLDPSSYKPAQTLPAKINRRLTQWKAVAPMPKTPDRPLVSFAFDDFPISAVDNGVPVLDEFDAKGTFYACTGLTGRATRLGNMFTAETLRDLYEAEHDIAAYSHSHIDCSVANSRTIQVDLTKNLVALRDYTDAGAPHHFAWPFGETKTDVKQSLKEQLATARGTLPGINRKGSDLMQLRAYGITPDEWTVECAEQAIEKVAKVNGWVIIYTHDVQNRPSPLGMTPATLRYLANLAQDNGVDIVSVSEAYKLLKRQMALPPL